MTHRVIPRVVPLLALLFVGGAVTITTIRRGKRDGATPTETRAAASTDAARFEGRLAELPERVSVESQDSAPDIEMGPLAKFGDKGSKPARINALPWTAGRTWKVETWYRKMDAGDAWSKAPILWKFSVRGRETLDGRDVWVLDIEPVSTDGMPYNPGGSVYVAVDDQSVVAVRDRVLEAGEIRERFLKFDDADGSATSSLLPVDLPAPGMEARARTSPEAVLPPDPFRPDPKAASPNSSGSVVDVEFEVEGVTIRQRWDAENPVWPLHSRTPSRVSYLRTGP